MEYDGKPVPDSPFRVAVEKIDVSKVSLKGLETRKYSLRCLVYSLLVFSQHIKCEMRLHNLTN